MASIKGLRKAIAACEVDMTAHTKRQLIEKSEPLFDLTPEEGRLTKRKMLDLMTGRLDELEADAVELPSRMSELEEELTPEPPAGPPKDRNGNDIARPVATAAKPPKLRARAPKEAHQLIAVRGKVTGVYRVASSRCKIYAGVECMIPRYAVDFLRERDIIE